ncbi:MAG: hypothetical protein QOJ51_3234 [Acidobacteriaceae bacterium]|nr:hypothetical protein [Acidobacteriaceae bacterium]
MDDTVCQLGHRKWDEAIRTRAESLVFVVGIGDHFLAR